MCVSLGAQARIDAVRRGDYSTPGYSRLESKEFHPTRLSLGYGESMEHTSLYFDIAQMEAWDAPCLVYSARRSWKDMT